MTEYLFRDPRETSKYRIFPEYLENDPLVFFHGTAKANLESIIKNGFRFGKTESVSFGNNSSVPLRYACEKRDLDDLSPTPEGVIIAIKFEKSELKAPEIIVNVSDIHLYDLSVQPSIIGYCTIPASYVHR